MVDEKQKPQHAALGDAGLGVDVVQPEGQDRRPRRQRRQPGGAQQLPESLRFAAQALFPFRSHGFTSLLLYPHHKPWNSSKVKEETNGAALWPPRQTVEKV